MKSKNKTTIISQEKPRICPPGACPSELRFDLVSKDWVVIATARARKPESFKIEKRRDWTEKLDQCPFCNIDQQESPTLIYSKGKKIPLAQPLTPKGMVLGRIIPQDWTTIVVPNKYPAFASGANLEERAEGPYRLMSGIGFHEVIVTRDHGRSPAQFSTAEMQEVLDVYQERYLDLMNEKLVNYISIFHNHGPEAGASVLHPHSQIIAIPITDPDINGSLAGSKRYWNAHKKCVHCVMLAWDRKDGRRVVYENKEFVVLCPFASSSAFEVRVFPKNHLAYFERMREEQKQYLADAFLTALQKLHKGLSDPPYNFFLHTAPCDGKNYDYYHWHLEILPKTATWAGFELGTGIEISTIEPEKAAEYLRRQ